MIDKFFCLKVLSIRKYNSNYLYLFYSSYVTDIDFTIAGEAIICMGQIALQVIESCEYCMQKLLLLLSLETDFITSHTLQMIKGITVY